IVPPAPGTERRLAEKVAAFGSRPLGQYAAQATLLLELGRLIDRLDAHPQPGRRHALYLRLCAFLEEHFSQPHTRESVAARFNISPGHLTRTFREEGGTGFTAFLNTLRLREAEALLASTSLSVQEVALQC